MRSTDVRWATVAARRSAARTTTNCGVSVIHGPALFSPLGFLMSFCQAKLWQTGTHIVYK